MSQSKKILKKDAEQQVIEVKKSLKECFPFLSNLIDKTSVYLLSNNKALINRNQIANEIGADERTTVADTAAEVLVGKNNFAILLYYPRIDKYIFSHYLRHEFGHVVSISQCSEVFEKAHRDIALDLDTELRCGAALWSELVAEVFAYRAEQNCFSPYSGYSALQAERFMDEAVNTEDFDQYPFAFYLAMFFEDPEILYYRDKYPNAAIGANNCDDEIMPIIERTLNVIVRLLDKDDFWMITEKELTSVGKCVNELWDYCSRKKRIRVIDEIIRF